jgi:hypothetical protein
MFKLSGNIVRINNITSQLLKPNQHGRIVAAYYSVVYSVYSVMDTMWEVNNDRYEYLLNFDRLTIQTKKIKFFFIKIYLTPKINNIISGILL